MKRIRTKYPEERINKQFVVYRIYCKISGKSYIGITADFESRLAMHWYDARKGRKTVLGRAIRKYGKKNFIAFKINSSDTWEDGCKKEKDYILNFNSRTPNGYNMTDGGDGVPGIEMTAETKEKMRQSHLGKGTGPDNGMFGKPGSMLGRKWTKEQREAHSERCKGRIPWNKGKKCPQLSGEKNGFHGKKHTKESLQKMRKPRNWKWTDEHRQKILEARKGCQVGIKHSQCKLTESDVFEIRRLYKNENITQKRLARKFGITQENIHCIVNRKSWAHI